MQNIRVEKGDKIQEYVLMWDLNKHTALTQTLSIVFAWFHLSVLSCEFFFLLNYPAFYSICFFFSIDNSVDFELWSLKFTNRCECLKSNL